MLSGKEKIKGISIVLCCYNSAKRLPITIEHIAKQQTPSHINWEVVLVNNNSTDDTGSIAKEEWQKYNLSVPFYVIDQPIPGLIRAREKAIEFAKYEYLLFCDDDNWLDKDYLSIAFKVMESNKNIGVLGGWGVPAWEKEPPDWLVKYAGCYATGPQGESSGQSKISKHVYGAGAIYKKSIINELKNKGFRSQLLGREGKALSAGEDHELCYAVYMIGYDIWYEESLKFKHFIPEERINVSYFRRLLKGFAKSNFILLPYKRIIDTKGKKYSYIKRHYLWVLLIYVYQTLVFFLNIIRGKNTFIPYMKEYPIIKLVYAFRLGNKYAKIKTFVEKTLE